MNPVQKQTHISLILKDEELSTSLGSQTIFMNYEALENSESLSTFLKLIVCVGLIHSKSMSVHFLVFTKCYLIIFKLKLH